MSKLLEELNAIRSKLKEMTTADNVDAMADLSKHIDKVEEEHTSTEKRLSECQEKLVDVVKSTSFREPPKITDTEDDTKSFDDILMEELAKVKNDKK